MIKLTVAADNKKWVNFRYVQEAAKTREERGPVRTICYLEPII